MYCPKCSQQQVSEEARFCSRCGFQLGVVKELLAQDDAPATNETETAATRGTLRKGDVRAGALLMFILALLVILASPAVPPVRNMQVFFLVVLFLALTLLVNFVTPLLRAVGKLFGEEAPPRRSAAAFSPAAPDLTTRVNPSANSPALPPSPGVPLTGLNSARVNTAEMAQPLSVTEHTTNLLNNGRD